jgi:hypothetical protein
MGAIDFPRRRSLSATPGRRWPTDTELAGGPGIGASLARSASRGSLHSPGRPAGCRSPLSGSRPSVSLVSCHAYPIDRRTWAEGSQREILSG